MVQSNTIITYLSEHTLSLHNLLYLSLPPPHLLIPSLPLPLPLTPPLTTLSSPLSLSLLVLSNGQETLFPSRRGYRIVASVHVTPLDSPPPLHTTDTETRARVCRGVGEVYEPVFNTPLVFPNHTTDPPHHPHPHLHLVIDPLIELKSLIDSAVSTLTALGPWTTTLQAVTPTSPMLPHDHANSSHLNPSPSPGPGAIVASPSPCPGAGASPCLDSAEAVGVLVHRLLLLLSSSSDNNNSNNHNDSHIYNSINSNTTNSSNHNHATATPTSEAVGVGVILSNGHSRTGLAHHQHATATAVTLAVAHYGFEQALLHAFARCAGE